MKFSIKLLYLYLFSFIGLLIAIIGSVQLVDLGMKVFVFRGADTYSVIQRTKFDPLGKETPLTQEEIDLQQKQQDAETTKQRQRQASTALAMLLVGSPLYQYHWRLIKKSK